MLLRRLKRCRKASRWLALNPPFTFFLSESSICCIAFFRHDLLHAQYLNTAFFRHDFSHSFFSSMKSLIFIALRLFTLWTIVLADCSNQQLTGLDLQCCLVKETFAFTVNNALPPTTCCQFPVTDTKKVICNDRNDGLKAIIVSLDPAVNGPSVSLFDMSQFPTLEELTVLSKGLFRLEGSPPSLNQIPQTLTKLYGYWHKV
ncbi:hypothetical protein BDR26DRAFT_96922 [Obelidium mucronatum]|nr:hypothetical protein BDR26DRAFT_96922 [Obelidium mucronatum]